MSRSGSVDAEVVNTFECSLARCLEAGDFTKSFYERFLGASDEVRMKFSRTDFAKQRKVIESSLYLMARATMGMEDGVEHLESVARSHSRKHLDIAPSHYALWLESLVATAREYDPQFGPTVEHAWRGLLQRGIDRMVDVYRHEQTVPPPRRGGTPRES